MQYKEYCKIWLNLTFAALSLTFIRGHKAFLVFRADRVIIGSPCGQGQLSTIWKVQCDWLSLGKECYSRLGRRLWEGTKHELPYKRLRGRLILFWTFRKSTHHFFRRLWKCFFIGVPKRRRLHFIQFVVSILRWFEELSSCPSPFRWSARDTRGKVFMLMSYPPNRTYRWCGIERLSKSWGKPSLWAFSEPDLLRFYTKNQADVHLNSPSLPRRHSWGFVTRSCAWRTPKIVCVGSYNTPGHSRGT